MVNGYIVVGIIIVFLIGIGFVIRIRRKNQEKYNPNFSSSGSIVDRANNRVKNMGGCCIKKLRNLFGGA